MYIDSHTHLGHKRFNTDRHLIMEAAAKVGVEKFIVVPIDLDSNFRMRELLSDTANVYFSAGIHPTRVWDQIDLSGFGEICKLAETSPTIAIGETGLDYHIEGTEALWQEQERWFIEHLLLAKKLNLPLILHIRDAFPDALRILKQYAAEQPGVVHCFDGSWEHAVSVLDTGLYLGISGIVTRSRNLSDAKELLRKIPLEKMLLETDCPFLLPDLSILPDTLKDQKRNTPLSIPIIAQLIADAKGIHVEEVEEVTTENAMELFSLD